MFLVKMGTPLVMYGYMDMALENIPVLETPKTKDETSFSFDQAVQEMKQGKRKGEDLKKFLEFASYLKGDAVKTMIKYLHEKEFVSVEFAAKMLANPKLLKRVTKLTENFAACDEKMFSLEEAEIYCQLMDSGHDDISGLIKAVDPTKKFKQLKPLDRQEVIAKNLDDMRRLLLGGWNDVVMENEIRRDVQKVLDKVGAGPLEDPATWKTLADDPKKYKIFCSNPRMNVIYSAVMEGRRIETQGKKIELFYRQETPESGPSPCMHIERYARNPESGSLTKLAFDIEQEVTRLPDGQEKKVRVLKNIDVVIDKDSRGSNLGPEFLISFLPLIKEYGIERFEFVANMKIGSYAWRKIGDIDPLIYMNELAPKERKELGPGPIDTKKAKGMIMAKFILPTYEKHMAAAINAVLKSINDKQEKKKMEDILVHQFMEKDYEALKAKALAGLASIEDLSDLGRGLDVVSFNEYGEIVPPGDKTESLKGHLGKASIMGIPWKVQIETTKESLMNVVDKLLKGKGILNTLKRTYARLHLAATL